MVQGYYTLEESAHLLGISQDELKQKARKGEIRSFQDRGTWRFRIQDIQEMARRSGMGSDSELPIGAALKPKPTDSPAPRSPKPKKKDDDVFSFALGDEEDDATINVAGPPPGSSKKGGSSGKLVQAGSDSDVRLVSDGSDLNFQVPADSDVKIVGEAPKSSARLKGPKSPKPTKFAPDQTLPEPADSGVRLVPMDSDSDVRIVGSDSDDAAIDASPPKGATDSDIRMEFVVPPERRPGPEQLLTEEINLDEELKKDEQRRSQHAAQAKLRQPQLPTTSPFELSESDLELAPINEQQLPQVKDPDGSSDYDLTPAGESSSPVEMSSSDEFDLGAVDDQRTVAGDSKRGLKAPASGINLGKPADSGISLEQGSDGSEEIEFELTLDAESTPKPATPKPAAAGQTDSDSEFELSLDLDSPRKSDSDSEFELTLDDAGGLAPLEADESGAEAKDIFETDFDVPALEDSGSDAVAVVESGETEMESSDFELAIGDDDVAADDDESGSQVVALDEEEAVDDAAETVTAKSRAKKQAAKKGKGKAAAVVADDFGDLDDEPMAEADLDAEDLDGVKAMPQGLAQRQAPWGIMPVLVLFPCLLVMIVLGILGFELVQTQQGYKPGPLTKQLTGLIDKK